MEIIYYIVAGLIGFVLGLVCWIFADRIFTRREFVTDICDVCAKVHEIEVLTIGNGYVCYLCPITKQIFVKE
jgi:hypothetical protein